jgi:hypothetical protein
VLVGRFLIAKVGYRAAERLDALPILHFRWHRTQFADAGQPSSAKVEVAKPLQRDNGRNTVDVDRQLRRGTLTRLYTEEQNMHAFQTPVSIVPTARVSDLVGLIRSEYEEMPGLCLTRAQVQRLWLLEPGTCDNVLGALVDAGYLRLTSRGYVRG